MNRDPPPSPIAASEALPCSQMMTIGRRPYKEKMGTYNTAWIGGASEGICLVSAAFPVWACTLKPRILEIVCISCKLRTCEIVF